MRAVVVAALAALGVAVLRHRARWPSRTAQARADGFSEGAVAERMRLTADQRRVEVERVDIGGDGTVTIVGRLPRGLEGVADAWGAEFSVGYRWPSAGRTPFGWSDGVPAETGTLLPTLAELRESRGWISGPMAPVPLEDSVEWWERNWPEPDRLEDEQDGEAGR